MKRKNKVFAFISEVMNLVDTKKINQNAYCFGENDLLPNEMIELVYNSGTATSCVSKLKSFIEADGFLDPIVSKTKANKTQTFDELLSEIASYVAIFEGFVLKVKYDIQLDGNHRKELYLEPIQSFRKTTDGHYVYNVNKGTKLEKKAEDKYIESYKERSNVIEFISKQKKELGYYFGEVVYYFEKKAGQEIYPISEWYSAFRDLKSDSEITKFELENLENGFFPSAVLTIVGEIDDTNEDENGMTNDDYLTADLRKFTSKGEGRRKLLRLNAPTKDMIPDLKTFDIAAIMAGMTDATDRISRKVARNFNVPPVLIGLETAGKLGSTQQLANEIQLFNFFVNRKQRAITSVLSKLIPKMDFTISTLNPVSFIPAEIWAVLTREEIRTIGGFKNDN